MYVIAEYATLILAVFTLSAFLFSICLLVLSIKDGLASRIGTSRRPWNAGTLFGARPAPVMVRSKTSRR
jgi:hypothetical protein